MKRIVSLTIVCILVASLFMGTVKFTSGRGDASGLADSAWPCYGHDRRNTERSPYDTSHVDGTEKWGYRPEKERYWSSPSIGPDGTIYIISTPIKNSNGDLYAINPDGTKKWNVSNRFFKKTSPTIGSDNTIYVGSQDDSLYAINPDGTEKWNFSTGNTVRSSATIGSDGTIYFGSYDNNLYAVNADGTEKWNFSTQTPLSSSPAIGHDGTIFFTAGNLYALDSSGNEKWNYSVSSISSPVIGSDGTIYIMSKYKEQVFAIDQNGHQKWNFTTEIPFEDTKPPAIGRDGTIYVGSDKLYALSQNGTKRWEFDPEGIIRVSSSPVVGGKGSVYIGFLPEAHITPSGSDSTFEPIPNFYALNPDGTERWNITTDLVDSSPAIGSNGTLYMGTIEGLYAIGGSNSEGDPSLPVYQVVILAVAIISVISIVYWKKRGSGRDDEKEPVEEESKGQTEDTL